jgi:hypothetical protein
MKVIIDSAESATNGLLHPAARWGSIVKSVLADRLAHEEDRKRMRYVRDAAEAEKLLPTLALREGWQSDLPQLLRSVVLARFEEDLVARAQLLATGDAPLQVLAQGALGPEELYERVLEETRSHVRLRASDASAVQCAHQTADELGQVCACLIGGRQEPKRWFTGEGTRYHLLCTSCATALPQRPQLRTLCKDCFLSLSGGKRSSDVNDPPFKTRASDLVLERRSVGLPCLDAREVRAVAPVVLADDTWLMLDREGCVHRADLAAGTSAVVGSLAAIVPEMSEPVRLLAADDGSFAAIAERSGRRAWVLDLRAAREPLCLQRDDYHPDVCDHPIAFLRSEGRLLLVHATLWNRLDVLDVETGAVITQREQPKYQSGDPRPPHYLDYFHCGLLLSPDHERILDNGWVWHPVGIASVFSLRAWLTENVWESEDGASRKYLPACDYFWDREACWLDARTVVLWGLGEDDVEIVPGVRIFDAVEGEELRSFVGPHGELACFAPYLIAYDKERGTSVWDAQTGERLLHTPEVRPFAAHPPSRTLLSFEGTSFVIDRLTTAQ